MDKVSYSSTFLGFIITRVKVTWDSAPAACQAKWPTGDKQYKDFSVGLATIRDDYDNNLIASMMYNADTNYDINFGYNQVKFFRCLILYEP